MESFHINRQLNGGHASCVLLPKHPEGRQASRRLRHSCSAISYKLMGPDNWIAKKGRTVQQGNSM